MPSTVTVSALDSIPKCKAWPPSLQESQGSLTAQKPQAGHLGHLCRRALWHSQQTWRCCRQAQSLLHQYANEAEGLAARAGCAKLCRRPLKLCRSATHARTMRLQCSQVSQRHGWSTNSLPLHVVVTFQLASCTCRSVLHEAALIVDGILQPSVCVCCSFQQWPLVWTSNRASTIYNAVHLILLCSTMYHTPSRYFTLRTFWSTGHAEALPSWEWPNGLFLRQHTLHQCSS